jgi:hypothetical protein
MAPGPMPSWCCQPTTCQPPCATPHCSHGPTLLNHNGCRRNPNPQSRVRSRRPPGEKIYTRFYATRLLSPERYGATSQRSSTKSCGHSKRTELEVRVDTKAVDALGFDKAKRRAANENGETIRCEQRPVRPARRPSPSSAAPTTTRARSPFLGLRTARQTRPATALATGFE